jgi:hypothetical protein
MLLSTESTPELRKLILQAATTEWLLLRLQRNAAKSTNSALKPAPSHVSKRLPAQPGEMPSSPITRFH